MVTAKKKDHVLTEKRVELEELEFIKALKFKKSEIVLPNATSDTLISTITRLIVPLKKMSIQNGLRIEALRKEWSGAIKDKDLEILEKVNDTIEKSLSHEINLANYIFEKHPVVQKVSKIRGVSVQTVGMIMGLLKDPQRFHSFGQVASYSGCTIKHGLFLSKRNLNQINKQHHEDYTGEEDDYTRTGYNTQIQSILWNVSKMLLQYNTPENSYLCKLAENMTERLQQSARNRGLVFIADATAVKENKKYKIGEEYIVGRDCYSLKLWVYRNKCWRIASMLLNFIWVEWLKEKGIKARDLYCIEYLGHNPSSVITLDDVLRWEEKANKK